MGIEIRGIHSEESDDLIRAVSTGFGGHLSERDLALERSVFEPDRAVAAVDGDTFVGGSVACTFQLSVPGDTVPCAGIISTAVLPTHRRRGILSAMMRQLLEDVRGREPISALFASEGSIYGRYGYGIATFSAEFDVPRSKTAFRSPHALTGAVRLMDREEALKTIAPIYDRIRRSQPGFLGHSEAWWPYRFSIPEFLGSGWGEYFFAVREGAVGPDGYVAYRIRNE